MHCTYPQVKTHTDENTDQKNTSLLHLGPHKGALIEWLEIETPAVSAPIDDAALKPQPCTIAQPPSAF